MLCLCHTGCDMTAICGVCAHVYVSVFFLLCVIVCVLFSTDFRGLTQIKSIICNVTVAINNRHSTYSVRQIGIRYNVRRSLSPHCSLRQQPASLPDHFSYRRLFRQEHLMDARRRHCMVLRRTIIPLARCRWTLSRVESIR